MARAMTFARDLGYLDAFFGKLEAHAATLAPARGARLRALLAEERARWTEIKGLLAEPGGSAATEPAPKAEPAPRRQARPLTVGSLIT